MHNILKIQKHAIFCNGHRANRLKEYLENWSTHGITIIEQTFCGLKEIVPTTMEL